jgi:hypothetical protein
VSARDGSRLAAVPAAGYRPAPRLATGGETVVTFVAETPGPARTFDFSSWSVSESLQRAFALAFALRTRPGGSVRTMHSANQYFRILRSFAAHVSAGDPPPQTSAELTPAQLKSWILARADHASLTTEVIVLKSCLRKVPGTTVGFTACLSEPNPSHTPSTETSYSRDELARILNAARRDVRRAAERIRAGRNLLRRWQAGELDSEPEQIQLRGRLLGVIDRDSDVPRSAPAAGKLRRGRPITRGIPVAWVQACGSLEEHFAMLHLTGHDVAAFVVLLTGLTGQNRSTILEAPAAHHRADGYTGGPGTAVVELDKPRRGLRRHMDVALVDVPVWAPAPADPGTTAGTDLRTPFGVYMLLHELAAAARHRMGSDKLIAWWSGRGGGIAGGFRRGLSAHQVADWARRNGLLTDRPGGDGEATALNVTLRRLRLTFTELQQRPVAHTERTLANEYLTRNRGNLAEYQQVVAAALSQQVDQARTRDRIGALSAEEVAEAAEDPARVAARHGIDAATLVRLLAGQLDTVLGGCVDNTAGPHNPGQACRASFMLCLSCPCARATPQHLPVQILVHDELTARRTAMTPLRWTERFALAHAQLADLLDRAGTAAVADARVDITDADRALVTRFLRRELDLP